MLSGHHPYPLSHPFQDGFAGRILFFLLEAFKGIATILVDNFIN
jgi:hypothetical protein